MDQRADPAPGAEIVPTGRGCIGSVVSNGCGCLAFLLGSALAVGFFGAHLLSGWGARAIEEIIGSSIEGTVEVTGVDLSWSEPQRARSVSIYSPDGDLVINAKLTFPSILDLIGERDGVSTYRIEIEKLDSRIAAGGTSDLARTFGFTPDSEFTPVEVLRERLLAYLSVAHDEVEERSLRVELVVNDALFDDSEAGHANVRIETLKLVARVNLVGAQIDLSACELRVDGLKDRLRVSFDAQFEYDDNGRLRLTHAALQADAIPRSVLHTLGLVSAPTAPEDVPRRRRGGDVYDVIATRARRALNAFMEDGAKIIASFDAIAPAELDANSEAPSPAPRLSLSLKNTVGEILFDADWRDGALVPAELADGRASLWMELVPPLQGPASIFQGLMPDGIVVYDDTPQLLWRIEGSEFRIPVDESVLVIGGGSASPRARDSRGVATWMRSADAEISLRNIGGEASRLHFDGGEDHDGPDDRLDLTHRLTTLSLMGELGGRLSSRWRTSQVDGGLAYIDVTLPARPLGVDDFPVAQLDASIPGMTLALLWAMAEIPDDLRVLLPRRLYRLELHGVPISRFMGPRRTDDSRVGVDVWTGRDVRFRGYFEDGEFHVPSAHFPLVITDDVCTALLLRLMPWLSEIEPLDEGATLWLTLREFGFTAGRGSSHESGEAVFEVPPMRIKLQPVLAQYFRLEDPSGWIEWTPAPIEMSLEPNVIRYRSVELPLGDDVEPSVMSGRFDRAELDLSITGLVDARSLSSATGEASGGATEAEASADGAREVEAGIIPVEITIKGAPTELEVLVNTKFLERTLSDMFDRVRGGG